MDGARHVTPAWAVRSIGRDEMGNVITKMKWVASYTEGDEHGSVTQEKVIVIRP
jgi:hypothetical protein